MCITFFLLLLLKPVWNGSNFIRNVVDFKWLSYYEKERCRILSQFSSLSQACNDRLYTRKMNYLDFWSVPNNSRPLSIIRPINRVVNCNERFHTCYRLCLFYSFIWRIFDHNCLILFMKQVISSRRPGRPAVHLTLLAKTPSDRSRSFCPGHPASRHARTHPHRKVCLLSWI